MSESKLRPRMTIDDLCAWLRTSDPEVLIHDLRRMLPGLDRNRRLLEAGERLAKAVTTFNDPIVAVREALAAYQEASKS